MTCWWWQLLFLLIIAPPYGNGSLALQEQCILPLFQVSDEIHFIVILHGTTEQKSTHNYLGKRMLQNHKT